MHRSYVLVCASFNTVLRLDARIRPGVSFVLLKMRKEIMYRAQPHMLCHSNLDDYRASSLIRGAVTVSDVVSGSCR